MNILALSAVLASDKQSRGWLPASSWLALVAALGTSCAKAPPGRSPIDAVQLKGTTVVAPDAVLEVTATKPSQKFLGLFRGVFYDYEVYDPTVLSRDLARIERYFHGRGFFGAHARTARVERTGDGHVRIEIVVDEGPPTVNDRVLVEGIEVLPEALASAARKAAERKLRSGRRFDEDRVETATAALRQVLTNAGYAYADVRVEARVDIGSHTIDYLFSVTPGPLSRFGAITFEGLDPDGPGPSPQELEEGKLREVLDIRPGEPFSTAAIEAATQALLDLGVFSSVEIEPELATPPSPDVPLTIHAEPTRLHQIRVGGGLDFDQVKTDLHLLAGWEDRNFFGKLRDLSVDFRPGVVLWPLRVNNLVKPDDFLPEERLRLQLRQPGFIESRTNGFVRPELNVYPLLVSSTPSPEASIIGYQEAKLSAGVDRRFSSLFVSLAYNLQAEWPFAYKGELDPALGTLTLLFPQLTTSLDLRDDAVHPHSGVYLSNDLQVSGAPIHGSAADVRVQPEIRGYVPLTRRVTFAARGALGFLFPSDYGSIIENDLGPQTVPKDDRSARVRDIETVYLRGFFSGGASSNRGYPYRGIAPHGFVPFLNPSTASQQVALQCDPTQGPVDQSLCAIPIAGLSLWELSVELRFKISGPFAASVFCDAGDVSPHRADLRFDHLHLSCGAGARYDTPVGPLRLDIGYRIQPLQVLGFANERAVVSRDPVEGLPPRMLGLPLAIAFGIGEAY